MAMQTIPFEQYQQLPPDKRSRPLTDAEYARLSPEQLAAAGLAEPSEGAPANFSGVVLPNPEHIQPRLDTDPIPATRLPHGVTFEKGNYNGGAKLDVSNPLPSDVIPAAGQTIAANMTGTPQHGPWEKYAATKTTETPAAAAPSGPWTKYAAPKAAAPAAAKTAAKSATPDKFAQDLATTEAWAEGHPIAGPIARGLVSAGQAAANAITKTPGQVYHAIADPTKIEEAGLTPEQRLAYRMGGKQAIEAGEDYAAGKVTPKGAASVLPEAIGTGVGTVAGGAVYGKGGEIAGDVIAPAVKAIAENPKAIATAPIRLAARSAETALNQKLVPLKKIANLGTPADVADTLEVKVPGRDLGLKIPKAKGAIEELDATAENKPFAGEKAPKPAKILDATGENRIPFAGGIDEAAPAAEPVNPALISPARTLPGQISPEVISPARIPGAAPIPARSGLMLSGEVAPAAAGPIPGSAGSMASSITEVPRPAISFPPEQIIPRMQRIAQRIPREEPVSGIEGEEEAATPSGRPLVIAGKEVNPNLDLTDALTQSIPKAPEAVPENVSAMRSPAELTKRWGVDEKSLASGREQTRGMNAGETEESIAKLAERYKKGEKVDPVVEYRDADNNITEVDGRARAIAAQRAGVERIPVIVRRARATP